MSRLLTVALLLLLSPLASAAEHDFTQSEFDRLNREQSPVLVHIHADWCPTCNRQQIILAQLLAQREFEPITLLRVDYDEQQRVVQEFGVRYQSTLIVFRKGKEVGRSTAEVDSQVIEDLLRKAL